MPRQPSQIDFFSTHHEDGPNRAKHGGGLNTGKRKVKRPLDTKKPVHITMRSEKAKGRYSLLMHKLIVDAIIETQARKRRIKLHHKANVGNHLHILVSFKRIKDLHDFLRTIAGMIARAVTQARKGRPFGKFWEALAFTRVITGLKAFRACVKYVEANVVEAMLGARERERYLRRSRSPRDLRD